MNADSSPDRANIAGLVLAAGESSRMGRDKALLVYRGRTFIETIALKLREAGVEQVAVVLGHNADIIRQKVNLAPAHIVVNHHYRRGQTSSLQEGLTDLERRDPRLDGIVMCLVDHPAFEAATVSALIADFHRAPAAVVIPSHQGRRGHPVLIARGLFAPLLALRPDQGANSVIRTYSDRIRTIEVADPGILVDVDVPESYHDLERRG
jgi:molybdenum cofactor cytidylyltransferase